MPPRLALLLLFLAVSWHLAGQGGSSQAGTSEDKNTIVVDVNMVVLQVSAHYKSGEFAQGLQKQDFHMFEDGQPQSITLFRHEDVPVSVGLVVDNSTSMAPKRKDVTAAAWAFAQSSNAQDQMFIVNFNERVSLGLPPERLFSASSSELEGALNGVPARGKTALYDAVEDGLAHLKKASCDKRVLIVISDGGDNASRHTRSQALEDAARSDAVIYTIGLFDPDDTDSNPGVLKELARATGGKTFLPGESSQVTPICERIAKDIREQYTIGYIPTGHDLDDRYHTIKVTVTGPHAKGVIVRSRAGYIASHDRLNAEPASEQSAR